MPQVCFDAGAMKGKVIATESQLFDEIRDIMYKRAGAGGLGSASGQSGSREPRHRRHN